MFSISRCSTASFVAFALTSIFAVAASAQPTMVVNGIPNPVSSNNLGVPHLKRAGDLSIKLKGTPNAPFCVMLAGDAYDGAPGGEPNITNGFFMKSWVIPTILTVPIHPVMDGIGMELIRQKLNASGQASLSPSDIVADVPSPVFKFNAAGEFNLQGIVPLMAFLVNLTPSGSAPNPVPIALESQGATTIALYMQIVEMNPTTQAVTSGTGMKVIFDQLTYNGTIAYAEGTSANLPSTAAAAVVTQQVFPATITDANFGDASPVAPVVAADFAFATQGLDIYATGLAGIQSLYSASNPANGVNGAGTPIDQDSNIAFQGQSTGMVGLWNQSSGIDFLSGNVASRNNENKDFPRLELPGNRSLFMWRDVATAKYGFGILFKDTNTWRNLTPVANFAFSNTTTSAAWEFEVAVTPDGNRALVVLDIGTGTTVIDRLFMLNLQPGGNFSNGLPIWEFVPSTSDSLSFRKIFEETIDFVSDGAGSWVGFVTTSDNATQTTATYPNKLFRVNVADSGGIPSQVLGSFPAINRIDRQQQATPDRKSMVVIAGSGATAENVYTITNVTTTTHSVINATGGSSLTVFFSISEYNEANDGQLGVFAVSPDSQLFAFAREDGTVRWPMVCKLDGSTAGQSVQLIKDITDSGVIDKNDFTVGRDYMFSQDSTHLLYQQGFFVAGALTDRMEVLVSNVSSTLTRNLTRTCKSGPTFTPATLFGPWDPQGDLTSNRPSLDPCGMFRSASGHWLYMMRELRGVASSGIDKQNVIGFEIGLNPGETEPSFNLVNLTGKEFAPYDGLPVPTTGTPDTTAFGSFIGDTFPEYHRFRRVGGTGPYKDFIYFIAQLAFQQPSTDPRSNIDQIFIFDPENPGPAIQLTNYFNGTGSPYAVRTGMRISNVIPSTTESKLMFIVDNGDIGGGTDVGQDLVMMDFANFGIPQRVPSTAAPYARIITGGSAYFFPGSPSGIVFASGVTQRPSGSLLDGFAMPSADVTNPLDATPFFYRTVQPSAVATIEPFVTASRSSMIFNVKAN